MPIDLEAALKQALALANRGLLREAEACLRALLATASGHLGAWELLGRIRTGLGDVAGAEQAWLSAIRLEPRALEPRLMLAASYAAAGELAAAAGAYQVLLGLDSGHVEAHRAFAKVLRRLGDDSAALMHFRFADWLVPEHRETQLNVVGQYRAVGLAEQARHRLGVMLLREPEQPMLRLHLASVCEAVTFSSFGLATYRRELEACLDQLLSQGRKLSPADGEWSGCMPPPELIYSSGDDRALKQKYAQLLQPAVQAHAQPPQQADPAPASARPQRIGLVVTPGHESTFISQLGDLFARLESAAVEVLLICCPESLGSIKMALQGFEVSWLSLPARLPDALRDLAQARCDLLFYWACGSDSLNYFLPLHRLARVQVAGWGWPVTSGIPNLDYMLSFADCEPEGADAHYSEQLIRLPQMGWPRRRRLSRADIKPRRDLGLPAEAHWYLCVENLLKIQPEFDALAADILRQDAQGRLILIGHRQQAMNQQFRRRLELIHPDVAARVHLLPPRSEWAELDYLSLIAQAEVMLDPLSFGGDAETIAQAFACGCPIITLPSPRARGRYVAAAYARIGVNPCVARDVADYARLAVRLGCEPAERQRVSQAILTASAAVETPVTQALADCLLALCQSAPDQGTFERREV